MASAIACYFTVRGDNFDPARFTERIGLTPTDTWHKGDRVGESLIMRKCNGWRYAIPRRESLDLSEVATPLLEQLLPHADAIREECARLGLHAELECIVWVDRPSPSVHFDAQMLKAIAQLGAEIDIDIY